MQKRTTILLITVGLANNLVFAADNNSQIVYKTQFQNGIDPKLMLQQPNNDNIEVAIAPCTPSQPAIRVTIHKQDDYSHVANGVPRAEISFAPSFNFQPGNAYLVEWSTCLPANFQFDNQQPEGITQIHPGQSQGSPPFGISLVKGNYEVELRDGTNTKTYNLGSAAADRGQWVKWVLHYRPDYSGTNAITELSKNGVNVLKENGQPNAYPNDNRAYFKFGIYKWWWQQRPSDVTERTIYFGDISVYDKT